MPRATTPSSTAARSRAHGPTAALWHALELHPAVLEAHHAGVPLLLLTADRPEELRGSAGTYRLREELIARANIALQPTRVVDVLFTELLVQ